MADIGVIGDRGPVDMEIIENFEASVGITFPKSYKSLISAHNNLYPRKSSFKFVDPWGRVDFRGIRFFGFGNVSERVEESLPSLLDPDDQELKGVVVIGDDGGGDEICFDYRDCPGTDDPPVVFLYHDLWWADEAGEWHRVIWPLAPSFDAFLEMLYERDDSFLDGGNEDGA